MRVLDSDTCIAILRGEEEVISRCEAEADLVATTWINAGELFYGAARSRDPAGGRERVASFLATLPVIGLDARGAESFGRLKAGLEHDGQRLADADLLIASIALAHDATVVTGNLKHYQRIEDLSVESWIPR